MNTFSGKLVKKNGTLIYATRGGDIAFSKFKELLQEGAAVDVFMEIVTEDGSLPQLAKVHAMIRTLSLHIGLSYQDTKMYVKDKAGLCISRTILGKELFECKSFSNCSRDELNLAIEACKELGALSNLRLS